MGPPGRLRVHCERSTPRALAATVAVSASVSGQCQLTARFAVPWTFSSVVSALSPPRTSALRIAASGTSVNSTCRPSKTPFADVGFRRTVARSPRSASVSVDRMASFIASGSNSDTMNAVMFERARPRASRSILTAPRRSDNWSRSTASAINCDGYSTWTSLWFSAARAAGGSAPVSDRRPHAARTYQPYTLDSASRPRRCSVSCPSAVVHESRTSSAAAVDGPVGRQPMTLASHRRRQTSACSTARP